MRKLILFGSVAILWGIIMPRATTKAADSASIAVATICEDSGRAEAARELARRNRQLSFDAPTCRTFLFRYEAGRVDYRQLKTDQPKLSVYLDDNGGTSWNRLDD